MSTTHKYLGMFSSCHTRCEGVTDPDRFNNPVNDIGVFGSDPNPSSDPWLNGITSCSSVNKNIF